MTYTIKHTNDITEQHATWMDTWSALVATYGDAIYAEDPHGALIDGDSVPYLRSGRVLVWKDDAIRAVATVELVRII